jgi:HD-GYP domain-containing protein (c-di-GMP phosphodiesterase class II)
MDGSGYPRGLTGNEIVIEARIIGVADVIDAMASYRPYRPALGVDAAIEEIISFKGITYDASVVDAFLKVHKKKFQDRLDQASYH